MCVYDNGIGENQGLSLGFDHNSCVSQVKGEVQWGGLGVICFLFGIDASGESNGDCWEVDLTRVKKQEIPNLLGFDLGKGSLCEAEVKVMMFKDRTYGFFKGSKLHCRANF